MEPVTHALASLTLARAGLNKMTRLAVPMAIVAGVAADADLLSAVGGAGAYLRFHRTMMHSLVGTLFIAAAVAWAFWWLGRKRPENPVRFGAALAVCLVSAAAHVLLDVLNPHGVQLLWPVRSKWYAWDLVETVDPWILILLVAGLVLPGLFRLVSEEIGARAERRGPRRGAWVAIVLVIIYCGVRYSMHDRALALLDSQLYRQAAPLRSAAYPSPVSPWLWHGVVETENTLEELEVPLGPGGYFSADRSNTFFKPEESPALDAARDTETVRAFVRFARFPQARVEKLPADQGGGFRVELRDLRFSTLITGGRRGVTAMVELDAKLHVTHEELAFASEVRR